MKHFEDFLNQVRERLDAGQREYGNRSFSLSPQALASEIQEELADVCGWSAILWAQLQNAKEAAERLTPRREPIVYRGASKTKPIRILRDTREKYMPTFPDGIEVETVHLPFGDYSAQGLSSTVALELKWSLDDLVACVTAERERFETMLAGLVRYPVRALIVAASERDVWAHRYHSRTEPKAVISSTWAWGQLGIPTIWANDRAGATEAILWSLERAQAKAAKATKRPKRPGDNAPTNEEHPQ